MSVGWVLKIKLMLSQLSTKLELKLRLSLAIRNIKNAKVETFSVITAGIRFF